LVSARRSRVDRQWLIAGSGSRQIVEDWLARDVWLLTGGVVSMPVTLASRRLRPVGIALVVLILVGLRPGYLPAPYVVALLPFCAVSFAAGAEVVGRRALTAARTHLPSARTGQAFTIRAGAALVLVTLVMGSLLIAEHWSVQRRRNDAWDANRATLAAERWMSNHVNHEARVLVDDTYFVDLVHDGFDPDLGVVWFYKLDFSTNLDPSVIRALPNGYRDFDYVVSSPIIRAALAGNPGRLRDVRRALQSSKPVVSFGNGANRVVIRRIVAPGRATSGRRGHQRVG